MKVSDYIAQFIAEQGVKHVFGITGGAILHVFDSISKRTDLSYVCTQHEQAAAMAADAYSRVTGNIGVVISTSGPGATNLLTGVCCAYYDSVPLLCITGQVSTFRLKKDSGVRQKGFQETNTIDIFRSVTKYTVLVEDLKRLRYELEKAVYIAKSGRPGPTLVDIPDNLQREDINPLELESFEEPKKVENTSRLSLLVNRCKVLISQSKRPVLILGWGVRLSNSCTEVIKLVDKLDIPVLLSWAAMDILPYNHLLNVGSFGLHGTRYGNFTVQNADLILSIGCRLDTHLAGSPFTSFARDAKKIVVDIDYHELEKFGSNIDISICSDAKDFIRCLNSSGIVKQDISEWKERIAYWEDKYNICPKSYYREVLVNPYVFVKTLSRECKENDIIFVDTGCGLAWMMQAFEFKKGQRLFSAFNNTPMGYALPASIGASLATNKPIICVIGDGGMRLNNQELATLVRHNLPVKIFIINNNSYSMVQQTQDQWMDSRYIASTVEGGLPSVNLTNIAAAYGCETINIATNKALPTLIRKILKCNKPTVCGVEINQNHRVIPQVKFGKPIEDSEPLLSREEFLSNMIVKPYEERN